MNHGVLCWEEKRGSVVFCSGLCFEIGFGLSSWPPENILSVGCNILTFDNQTTFDNLNTELVPYSDPHC